MNFNNQGHYESMAQGFMSKVYGWMCAGLGVTALVSYYLSPEVNPQLMRALMSNWALLIGLFVVQFGIIMFMSWKFNELTYSAMALLFMTFALLQGITLSPILYMYTASSVFYIFGAAAGMFAIMALYGYFTKSDLSSLQNILFMGLIGLCIAPLINLFFKSATFDMVTSSIGVGIFALLIAYDVQNLKNLSRQVLATPSATGKIALMGALSLYLNLINIFLYLLRLFGERKER